MNAIRPDICVSIGNISFDEIASLLPTLRLAELRIDLLNLSKDELRQIMAMHKNLIATYRPKSNEFELMHNLLNEAIEWGAAWVDIDIETPNEIIKEISAKAKSVNCKVIISYHNYHATPSISALSDIVARSQAHHIALTKIASMANNPNDCARMLSLYDNHSNILAFCMGQIGTITRVAAPFLGAPFTYASLQEKQTAPGQLDYISLNNLLNTIKPL
ncbi:MAG: type I 3-dehydroquinate dehydratase [Bacteroidota bacterium]